MILVSEEVALNTLALMVTYRVAWVGRVPVVASLDVHGAVRADRRAVLVVWQARRASSVVAVALTTPRRHSRR